MRSNLISDILMLLNRQPKLMNQVARSPWVRSSFIHHAAIDNTKELSRFCRCNSIHWRYRLHQHADHERVILDSRNGLYVKKFFYACEPFVLILFMYLTLIVNGNSISLASGSSSYAAIDTGTGPAEYIAFLLCFMRYLFMPGD